MDLRKVYHYTSEENWSDIQMNGVLLPRSRAYDECFPIDINIPLRVNLISPRFFGLRYLVGLGEPHGNNWRKAGLFDYLLHKTSGEVLLEVPVLHEHGCFVRNHFPFSPKKLNEKHERDLYKFIFYGLGYLLSRDEIESFNNAYLEYVATTKRLEEYDGSFEAPEFWLPQTTPIKNIKRLN